MKYSVETIKKMYENGEKLKYIFFWGHTNKNDFITKSCFSQWYECNFVENNILYNSSEQYMMAKKSLLFNDIESYENILNSNHPSECKKFGRMVKNFDENIWNKNKYDIVLNGNILKFSQNDDIKEFLLNTNKRIIVEASPYDKIWGIGISSEHKNVENPYNWQGENLLGFILMEVRDLLR